MVVAVTGSIPRVRLDTVVPETVPQTYSMSVRPSSSVKRLKPENGAAPRTVADTRERNVSVELMRSSREVSERLGDLVGLLGQLGWTAGYRYPKRQGRHR
jgi:hypothetical protein